MEEPIERLRLLATEALEVNAEKVCVEPADLAKLVEEVERLNTLLLSSAIGQEYERLRAENERLREALRKIAPHADGPLKVSAANCGMIARAALQSDTRC
jgi:hypothetical protein